MLTADEAREQTSDRSAPELILSAAEIRALIYTAVSYDERRFCLCAFRVEERNRRWLKQFGYKVAIHPSRGREFLEVSW